MSNKQVSPKQLMHLPDKSRTHLQIYLLEYVKYYT